MDGITGTLLTSQVTGWGAFGIVSLLLIISIMRGWLVPIRTHDRELKAETRRGDEWKETALHLRNENSALIEGNKIVSDFFEKVTVDTGGKS